MADVSAIILQAAQVINQTAMQRQQFALEQAKFQEQKKQYADSLALQEKKLKWEEAAFEAERTYKDTLDKQRQSEFELRNLQKSNLELEGMAADRFGDPSLADNESRASSKRFAAYRTTKGILDEINTHTRTATQYAPGSTEHQRIMVRIQELQREVGYRSSWRADKAAAAMYDPKATPEERAAAEGVVVQAVEDVAQVDPNVPVPGKPLVPPGSTAPASKPSPISPNVTANFRKIVEGIGKRPKTQLLSEIYKAADDLKRTDKATYDRMLPTLQRSFSAIMSSK